MKDTAPKELGILAVAALFGFIAFMVCWLIVDFQAIFAAFLGAIVALIVAIFLWLGWRDAAPGPTGPRDLSAQAHPRNAGASGAGGAGGAATTAAASGAGAAATATASADAAPSAQPAPTAKPVDDAAKSAPKAAPADPEPTPEATSSGDAPEMLSGPRDGGPDDLKLLKGVGPKLEGVLNNLGVYHFDQVASWGPSDVAWVDERLKFKGRIERDGWIDQAKILAAGGETEFSKRSK